MADIVSVSDLSFSYGSAFRLHGISFSVEAGQVLTLLGPNGCGKTTLLKCINSLLVPEAGEILVCGQRVKDLARADLARLIGFVPQTHTPPFPFTVIDVVLMGRASHLSMFQQPSSRDYAMSERALELVGIAGMRDRIYTQISGGERQLVLIARAIAQEPRVLLLDEPTAHLDFKNQLVVLKMVNRICREKGLSVVMSLHDPNHALAFSDRVALLANGKVLALGKPLEVISAQAIMSAYGIETKIIRHETGNFLVPAE